jgi:glycosyltransferase involved in cell wall biosynthesis
MKIAKISSFFWPVRGGMENHLYYEGREIIKLGHDLSIFTSDSARTGKITKKTEEIDGIKVKRHATWFKLSYFTPVFPSLINSVLFEDYDILHVHSYRQFHNFAIIFAKLRGKPTVLSMHWPEYPNSVRNRFLNHIIKVYDKTIGPIILSIADKLIVQTEAEKLWLQKKFRIKSDKIEILPPGFDSFYLEKRNTKKFKETHKIKEKFIVLCIGRIHRSKRFDKLIKIASDFKNTKFVFLGPDGGHKNELENLVKKLKISNKILFTGEVSEEEKLDALAACSVLVMPSDYEAFGIALIEAMAQGKPVIAANSGGMPCAVGNCGLIFEKENVYELKQKLLKLLQNKKLRNKLSNLAKRRAESYTWQKLTGKLENIYNGLLKVHPNLGERIYEN